MPGPARKPTAIAELNGNPSHRKKNRAEPKPTVKIPNCPEWLTDTAKEAYQELAGQLEDIKVLTTVDRNALTLLCDAYAEYKKLRLYIMDAGHTYEVITKNGELLIKARPEVSMCQNAWERVAKMLKEFGLTPAARTKVQMTDSATADPMEDFLSKSGKPKVVK